MAASTPSPLSFWMSRHVSNDKDGPSPPPPQSPPSNMQTFMNGLVSPFLTCWQPPLPECGPIGLSRSSKPAVVSPVIDRTKSTGSFQSGCSSVHPSMIVSWEQQPLIDIEHPHNNDVLCGRGGSSNRHVGNLNFRELVGANKKTYVGLTKKQKMLVARKIVDTVHNTNPPGRFLSRDIKTGLWYDIGLQRSLEKTSQALREKSAGDREKSLIPDGDDDDDEEVAGDDAARGTTTSPTNVGDDVSTTPSAPLSPASSMSSVTSTKETVVLKKKSSRYIEAPPLIIPPHLEPIYNPRKLTHTRSPPVMGYGCWPQFLPHPPPPRHMYPPHGPHHGHPMSLHHHYPPTDYREHHVIPPRHPMHHTRMPPPQHTSSSPSGPPGPPPPRATMSAPPPPPPPPPPPAGRTSSRPPIPQSQAPPLKPSPVISQSSREAFVPPLALNLRNNNNCSSTGNNNDLNTSVRSSNSSSNSTNGSAVREGQEISPGRRQAWKKQRTVDGMTERRPDESDAGSHLSQAIESKLSLEERVIRPREMMSPSAMLQSRSRRVPDVASSAYYNQSSSSSNNHQEAPGDLSGLAALSAAAFLKLDEEN